MRNYHFARGYIRKIIILPFPFRRCDRRTVKRDKEWITNTYKTKELSFTLQGFSTFGREDQPRILWAKVSENHDLFQLQKQVHAICEENGFL